MTNNLSPGVATRASNLSTATVVALAMLTMATAVTPSAAQQPDPAAAAAAAHKAKCDPQVAAVRALEAQDKEALSRAQAAHKRFNDTAGRYDQTYTAYVKFRDSGDHLRAWQMVPTIDGLWARLRPLNEELIAARSARASITRQLCAGISRGTADGCFTSNGSCTESLQKQITTIGNSSSRRARLAGTWKTAADEKLNPANAAKGCPIAKTIAPSATVTFVSGRVFVTRGVRTLPAATGMTVHPGDVVAVEEGSQASLNLFNGGIMKISEKTKFEIPNPVTAPPPPGISANLWAKAKQLIQGESFEIKTPTACTGSRG
ncbi:MAG: hypothetical protein KIT48_04755 [Pseudolabrys sp.]|nr:hypothetical protein [Pseudolabrys sp.]